MKYFMKKNGGPFLIALILMVIAVSLKIFLFGNTNYDENKFEYDSLTFDANIEENGDMSIKETFEIKFNTDRHGVTRDIITSRDGGYGKSLLDTSSVNAYMLDENKKPLPSSSYQISTSFDHDILPGTYGEILTFPSEYGATGESIDFYMPHGMGNKKYCILEYKLIGAVTTYNDVSELNWRFFSPYYSIKAQNVKVNISYPNMGSEKVTFYGHASNGKLDSSTSTKTSFSIKKMYDGDLVECRLVFPGNVISSSYVKTYNGLDEILAKEQEIERGDKLVHNVNLYGTIGSYVLLALLIGAAIFIFYRYDKEYKPEFEDEYYRELVNDYGPAVMSYLVNFKEIDANCLQAVIMNLIYKKYIEIDYSGQSTIDKDADYKLVLKNDSIENLNKYEREVMLFLFKTVSSDKKTLRLSELENYTTNYSSAMDYQAFSNRFKSFVFSDARQYDFFDNHTENKCKTLAGIFGVLSLSAIGLVILAVLDYSLMLTIALTLVAGILLMLTNYCTHIKRRSKNGNEEYTKWMAFKHFLCDFSNIKDYSMPSVVIMEHYLVYATAFGVADLVEEQMDIKLKDSNIEPETYYGGYTYYPMYRYNYYFRRSMRRSMNTMAMNSTKTIAEYRAKSATGSGGSGGFGGGSSFGGGGGGMRSR